MKPPALARLAGVLYLAIIIAGIGSEVLLRGPLVVTSDPSQTLANLTSSELRLRLSIIGDVAMAICDVGLAISLYYLLRPVDSALSLTAMVFRLVQAAILATNLLNLHRVAALLDATALDAAVQTTWVMNLLDAHATGYDIGLFFFGINCLLVGVLIQRSDFLPRALGWMIVIAGVVYLMGSTVRVIAPAWVPTYSTAYVIPLLAELGFCGWLLAVGSRASVVTS